MLPVDPWNTTTYYYDYLCTVCMYHVCIIHHETRWIRPCPCPRFLAQLSSAPSLTGTGSATLSTGWLASGSGSATVVRMYSVCCRLLGRPTAASVPLFRPRIIVIIIISSAVPVCMYNTLEWHTVAYLPATYHSTTYYHLLYVCMYNMCVCIVNYQRPCYDN